MLQKTEMSEASTNAEFKVASFFTSKSRQMFRQPKKNEAVPKNMIANQISTGNIPNDVIFLEPSVISSLTWPQIYLFENDLRACIKGNFYEISGLKGKNKFLPRKSSPKSQIVYFWAEKPTTKINLITIERYLQKYINKQELWNHINITRFECATNNVQCEDFYICCQQKNDQNNTITEVWDFCSLQVIENMKKGIFIFKTMCPNQPQQQNHYKIILADLTSKKKISMAKKQQKCHLKILCSADLDCQTTFGREDQVFIKSIKSEFGDITLIVTSKQIYEIEVEEIGEGYKINIKAYKIYKAIISSRDNYLKSNPAKTEEINQYIREANMEEKIEDAQFMSNGLKIMILTNYEQIIVIEANNLLFSQSIRDILLTFPLRDKYNLQAFGFTNLYSVNGSIALEFHSKNESNLIKENINSLEKDEENNQKLTKGIMLLKAQTNNFSALKIVNLPFHMKQMLYVFIQECSGLDQFFIQYIEKKNPCILNVIKCRILMSEINLIIKIDELQYNYTKRVNHPTLKAPLQHYYPCEQEKEYKSSDMPISSKVFYLLNDKELTCYKIFNEMDCQKISKDITKLFTHTFFEKPIKITVSPLTLHFVIVFKEFVKFFHFNYSSIKNYYTLKVKNINDVQFINTGQKLLISCSDGAIILLDAYTFREEKIMEFYGEPLQTKMIDQSRLFIKSNKNFLSFYQKENLKGQYQKKYQVKLEQGDQYTVNRNNLVIFRKNVQIQVYTHTPHRVPDNLLEAQRQCYQNMHAIHKHLENVKKCQSFANDEFSTKMLLSEQLGFLFVSTNKGNLKQYLWPLQLATNPNPPDVFTQQVSYNRIISLYLDAKYTNIYSISENGVITKLNIRQYINGELMPYVYLFSEKTKGEEEQKREFTDRNYFIDNFTPTELILTQTSQRSIDELEFFIDKIKDDIEQMTKTMVAKQKITEITIKKDTKFNEKQFQKNLENDQSYYKNEVYNLKTILELNQKQFESQKSKEIQKYQKTLLDLYKQSDRLKKIMKTQHQKLTEEKQHFDQEFQENLRQLEKEKDQELNELEKQYKAIEEQKRLALKQNQILEEEEESEMKLYKVKIHEQEENQLKFEQETKERLLGENTKKEKAIVNLKNRGVYFENLILETKVQISQLRKDQKQYQSKKEYLNQELKDKQDIIEKIQRELVQYLKNTQDMKTIKNNHQFELEQYENEVAPIQNNHGQIEDNVKHMNLEIMKEYNLKINKIDLIKQQNQLISTLKEKKKNLTIKKLEVQGKFRRLAEKLTYLSVHMFNRDIKNELKILIDINDKSNELIRLDEEKQRQRREGEKLLRYKNMVRKEIQEQEKREEHIIKNQHQYYKYHYENTTLVRQFNELKKTQKLLTDEQNKLMDKVNLVKASRINTPKKRGLSSSNQKGQQKHLTPFQRYQEGQTSIHLKKQETSDTKVSKNSQSLSFLKGLMKEVNNTDSKYEKMQVMRQRVRTFVNPELKMKQDEIKKILFGRTRGASQMLKLK